ncbi:MAG: AAA family ATPase [Candidatus Hydrogenedentes bacterium]|nr:AAA family ATPase [Candidatus Hydrogenedentota bacterium]
MYLSRIRLQNWRSYEDSTFSFLKPTMRKPLYLIGAMNGHGKTSLLVALYLGIFGRFGLRHCDGFSSFTESQEHYNSILPKFRRNNADPKDPTEIELVFSPTLRAKGESEIRVVRRWHFSSNQRLKPGNASEELQIYEAGQLVGTSANIDTAHDTLERLLFPAHIAPAFFFDGEQAQTLINTSTSASDRSSSLTRSVQVLFGTKIIDELNKQMQEYVRTTQSKIGGKKKASEKEQQLRDLEQKRDQINDIIAGHERSMQELSAEKEQLERERNNAVEQLTLKGYRGNDLAQLSSELANTKSTKDTAESALKQCLQSLGLSLAVSRLHYAIERRLQAEEKRESWEGIKLGTIERAGKVLQVAMPEPPEQDDLLGHLSTEIREKVKSRFSDALTQIYNPPPSECAESYILGHVRGDVRSQVIEMLREAHSFGADTVRSRVRKLQDANISYNEARIRFERETDAPQDLEDLRQLISDNESQIGEAIRRIGGSENEVRKYKSDLHTINGEIRRLRDEIATMEPEQKRIAIADRVRILTGELTDKLQPIALGRLQELVTSHFTTIADPRYSGGRISFPEDGQTSPMFTFRNSRQQSIDSMSGFERRTFGIAFSLALAEMTGRRVPLVIDTPLGNADSEYRPRLMKALTKVDLDQIIILTHDQEVTEDILSAVEVNVSQKVLVKFDHAKQCSVVHDNTFFGESHEPNN